MVGGKTNYSFVPRAEGSRCAGAESAIFEEVCKGKEVKVEGGYCKTGVRFDRKLWPMIYRTV
jgi:hypothetical protein